MQIPHNEMLASIRRLLEVYTHKLTKWEKEFLETLLNEISLGKELSEKQSALVSALVGKMTPGISDKMSQETERVICKTCLGKLWILIVDKNYAERCHCSGGREFVYSQMRSTGMYDALERLKATMVPIQASEGFDQEKYSYRD